MEDNGMPSRRITILEKHTAETIAVAFESFIHSACHAPGVEIQIERERPALVEYIMQSRSAIGNHIQRRVRFQTLPNERTEVSIEVALIGHKSNVVDEVFWAFIDSLMATE